MMNTTARYATWIAMTGAALFLGACVTSTEDQSAIDPLFKDAKVDARVAGQSLAGSFDQGKQWNTAITAPTGLQALGDISTQLGTLKKRAALAKGMDIPIGADLKANLDDTAKGFATLYSETNGLLVNTKDTAIVKWDDLARDTIKNNEHILSWKQVQTYIGGKVETSTFTDGDKDGIVTPVPGKDNRVKIDFTVSDNGTIEKTSLLVGAGGDANFDNDSDNTVLEANWTKTKGGVVTGQGAYLDGDGDGIVTDNRKDCIVIAKYSEMDPAARPLVKKVTFEAKIKVLAKKAGNEPVSFSYEEEMKSGRVNTATLKNREGGSQIVRGDTMTVRLETTVASADDTLKHAVVEFVMNPGQDLNSDLDDSCYAIHITTEKRFGLERSAEFNFVSDAPIPHGQEPKSGTFSGKATYANGKSASLKGSFTPTRFKAEYTGPEGGTATVEFTKSGDLVSNP